MGQGKATVRAILDQLQNQGRSSLTAPECHEVCTAYGIPLPNEGLATSANEAARLADEIGYPVVMKIVSPDILHKTEAGGVIVGVSSAAAAKTAYQKIVDAASSYAPKAKVEGVQVQQMLSGQAQEVIVGAVTDPSFGKLVAFGLGGILVEVLKDVTFRLAPASTEDALSMLDGIQAAEVLRGVRGADPVDRDALAAIIVAVSNLIADFPEIQEIDLNPVFATKDGATAVDALISVDFTPPKEIYRPSQEEILVAMNRIFHPRSVAVIGASAEDGKIGNSVMKNLINGGYAGAIYPVHPKAEEILGKKVFKSVLDIPGEVDLAVFAIPAKFCAAALDEVGKKDIPAGSPTAVSSPRRLPTAASQSPSAARSPQVRSTQSRSC
jgi:acyl-CoA synthetase (NDP forming)